MSWRERLRAAIDASGRKYSAIAADAGITPVTLSRILNAVDAKPAFETIVCIAHAVHENVGWLLDETGFVLSTAQMQKLADTIDFLDKSLIGPSLRHLEAGDLQNATPDKRAEIPRQEHARGARLVYRALGSSMTDAGIADGDFMFVKPVRDIRAANGFVVVCRVGAAEYVKQLEIRGSHARLLSRNPGYAPMEVTNAKDLELIGVVIGRSGPPRV